MSQSNSFSISSTLCQFSVTSSPSHNFMGSFHKVFNRTRQTSPLLHLNDFKTKSKLKWILQSKERHKTVNRSWHHWNNLNLTDTSILLILEIRFMTLKSCNTLWKKVSVWAMRLTFLWYPHAMTFLVLSWHFHSENF